MGLAEALNGAAAVVDVSNSPSFDAEAALKFLSTGNLRDAEAAAGVGHQVARSVVGTDCLGDAGYFYSKIAQEKLIARSSMPYSIVHATQFFEFITSIADTATDGDAVRVAPVLIQPMAADDVVSAVGRVGVGAPLNRTVEVAGPEQFRLDELTGAGLAARHDPRQVVSDPHALYFGWLLPEQRTLILGDDAELAATRFIDWLSQSTAAKSATSRVPTFTRPGAVPVIEPR